VSRECKIELTKPQKDILLYINQAHVCDCSLIDIRVRLGYSNVATWSVFKALKKKGLAFRIGSRDDQWSVHLLRPTDNGQKLADAIAKANKKEEA